MIVPTLGRPTLARTLASCADADEIIVCADTAGDTQHARTVSKHVDTYLECPADQCGRGYAQRQFAIERASGTHLAFLDDDDTYTPDAIGMFREAACGRPVIFRMNHDELGVVWRTPSLTYGNVGTPMLLVPNLPERLGRWHPHVNIRWGQAAGGDFTFIRETVERMGGPVWRPEIVATVRP